MHHLSLASQRGRPYVFVGREAEIGRIHHALNEVPPHGRWRGLLVVEGAPGAGKSALLEHMCDLFADDPDTLAIYCGCVPQKEDVGALYGDLATHLTEYKPEDARRRTVTELDGGVNVAAVRGGMRRGSELNPAPPPASTRNITALSGFAERLDSGRRAVVFVDEAQELEPGSPAATMFKDLRSQVDVPVLTVCGGVSDVGDALEDAGMTRPGEFLRMSPLTSDEAEEAVRRTLEGCVEWGLMGWESAERWSRALAKASDGWPSHLHRGIAGALAVLAEQAVPDLRTASLDEALRRGKMARQDYYASGIRRTKMPGTVSAHVHRAIEKHGPLRRQQALSMVGEAVDTLNDARAIEDIRGNVGDDGRCLRALIHAGVLAHKGAERLVSPIPSFSNYLFSRERERDGVG